MRAEAKEADVSGKGLKKAVYKGLDITSKKAVDAEMHK